MKNKTMNYKETVEFIYEASQLELWKAIVENKFSDKVINKILKNQDKNDNTSTFVISTRYKRGKNYIGRLLDAVKYATDGISVSDNFLEPKVNETKYTEILLGGSLSPDIKKTNFKYNIDDTIKEIDRATKVLAEKNMLEELMDLTKAENQLKEHADKLFQRTNLDKIDLKEDVWDIESNKYYLVEHAKQLLLTKNNTELRFDDVYRTGALIRDLKEYDEEAYLDLYKTIKENNVKTKDGNPFKAHFKEAASGDIVYDRLIEYPETKKVEPVIANTNATHKSTGGISDGR